MASKRPHRFACALYAGVIGLYPQAYRKRFGEEMMQIFTDLCRERTVNGGGIAGVAAWTIVETLAGAARQHVLARTAAMYMSSLAIMYILVVAALGLDGDLVAPLYLGAIGVILIGGGIVFVETRGRSRSFRAGIGVALGLALLTSWANPAIGMIGNESNQSNLVFLGVLAVGLVGSLRARFQPRGMSVAMFAMAATQLLVGLFCFVAAWPLPQVPNAVFAAVWVAAGLLIRRDAPVPTDSFTPSPETK